MNFYGDRFRWWYGVVVNTAADPMRLGRALVRIYGIHSEDIPDNKLPWASVVVPTTEGGVSGIGQNPNLRPGARVIGFFLDGEDSQFPVIFGSIPGVEGHITSTAYSPPLGSNQRAQTPGAPGTREQGGPSYTGDLTGTSYVGDGYPSDMPDSERVRIIVEEANLRGIDPAIAVAIYRSEGAGRYQSTVERSGSGSYNGYEASFGPYQLFVGGGLGNEYQELTGRNLITDNTREGITTQIRFALDRAATGGWGPWYGRLVAGPNRTEIPRNAGLSGARPINNWR